MAPATRRAGHNGRRTVESQTSWGFEEEIWLYLTDSSVFHSCVNFEVDKILVVS